MTSPMTKLIFLDLVAQDQDYLGVVGDLTSPGCCQDSTRHHLTDSLFTEDPLPVYSISTLHDHKFFVGLVLVWFIFIIISLCGLYA